MTNLIKETKMENDVKNKVQEMRHDIALSQQNAIVAKESEVSNMLQVIAQCAKDPNVDIAKMTALRDMRDQELARMKEEAFASDYVAMKDELPRIIKSKDNTQTKSKYAPLEDVNSVVDPILRKYGFATSTPIKSQTPDGVTVEAILIHKSGHKERTEITMPIDNKGSQGTVNKTMVHGISSSIMYARRVALCAILNISTGDDIDGNALNKSKSKSFQDQVNADSKKAAKSPPKPIQEEQELPWDKKTIYLLNNKMVTYSFNNSTEAGEILIQELANLQTKKERIQVVSLNTPIMRALIKKGSGELIDRIHKFADEGK